MKYSVGSQLKDCEEEAEIAALVQGESFEKAFFAVNRPIGPGFGENMRPLRWIVERAIGRAGGKETPIGWMHRYEDMDWRGLEDFSEEDFNKLMSFDRDRLRMQTLQHEELFLKLFQHLPKEMIFERELLISRL